MLIDNLSKIKRYLFKYALILLLVNLELFGSDIKIVGASDLTYALQEIKQKFISKHPNTKISLSLGSSGKAYTQILHQAPYDIYFSADMDYVKRLYKKGFTLDKPKIYAYGRIGIWVANSRDINISRGIDILLSPKIKKISIANPRHAPYGKAAVDVLKNRKIYNRIKDKLIRGENVSQAVEFALSGASDVVIAPLSLAKSKQLEKNGKFYLFPTNWHKPIIQGYALLKRAKNNQDAKDFEKFLQSKEARDIFIKYGFKLPKE